MRELERMYRWALEAQLSHLQEFICRVGNAPLLVVGSGGSLTVAHFAAMLHSSKGAFAKAITPLGLRQQEALPNDSAIIIISASGSNPDIIGAFYAAIHLEPRYLAILCLKPDSPLSKAARRFKDVVILEFLPPIGRDGFLATNSLLALSVILSRSYTSLSHWPPAESFGFPQASVNVEKSIRKIKTRETWLVLYGVWGLPAALDLESKFSEAALGRILLSDFRNFAHGRHFWLARRPEETGVLALTTPEDRVLANKTLKLLPVRVPKAILSTQFLREVGSLELLIKVFHVVELIGDLRKIDPGRPGVPEFGRRIFHLSPKMIHARLSVDRLKRDKLPIAVRRKLALQPLRNLSSAEIRFWNAAYKDFIQLLRKGRFGAVVCDYDGTLCGPTQRYSTPSDEIIEELCRLLGGGVIIGIATGRGRSVRDALSGMIPTKLHSRVLIGYYSGSDIALLSDETRPNKNLTISPYIDSAAQLLLPFKDVFFEYAIRPNQITITPIGGYGKTFVHSLVTDIVMSGNNKGMRALASVDSIDVLAPNASKLAVVAKCQELSRSNDILCIGDQGAYPGNDFELLNHPHSLSVDTVSTDPRSCWNISADGIRGVQATVDYLRRLKITNGIAILKL